MKDNELDGVLAEGTKITGKLSFERAVRIDGRFEGEVKSVGKLILGPSAEVDAEIDVGQLEVQGRLRGEVKASQRMLIQDGGLVEANIMTGRLAIEAGAVFRGHCEMPEQEKLLVTPQSVQPKPEKNPKVAATASPDKNKEAARGSAAPAS